MHVWAAAEYMSKVLNQNSEGLVTSLFLKTDAYCCDFCLTFLVLCHNANLSVLLSSISLMMTIIIILLKIIIEREASPAQQMIIS